MPPKKELTDQKFGKLIALRENGRDNHGKVLWECRCECGEIITVIGEGLTRGNTKGCPDCKFENLTGQKFGKLTVLELIERTKGHGKYKCLCECGKETVTISTNLKQGKTKSCGCGEVQNRKNNWEKITTHGLSEHPLYVTWNGMKARCYNPNSEKFPIYGGRGIIICDEWEEDFKAFYDWSIANGWQEGLTIDRIDNDGIYEPSNCRMADDETQANNKSTSVYINYNGEKKTIAQWAKHFNMPQYLIGQRLRRNWPVEKIFSTRKYQRVG